MVQRIFFVIQFTLVSKGIVSIKQDVVQRPGDREDAGQTNCAKRLQPIGVWTIFASALCGEIPALKLCASIA